MNWKRVGASFKYAWRGLIELWLHQQNFRIEVAAGILIMLATYAFDLRSIERGLILLTVLLVWAAEIMNSVFETVLDGISREHNEKFRAAKDIMAGMTLVMAAGSVLLAAIIFYPYIRFLLVG